MKIIDISWPITSEMTAYKDKQVVHLQQTKQFAQDGARETLITLSSHTGTHIDAPAHFLQDGKTMDQLDACCVGPAQVIDMTHIDDCIDNIHLQKLDIQPDMILLFKTKNSGFAATAPFNYAFTYVNGAAAAYLVSKKIKAVGIDYLGIERNQPNHETHETFMKSGITIIEGLRLYDVEPGSYMFWCLPLKMPGLDGAPARAILLER